MWRLQFTVLTRFFSCLKKELSSRFLSLCHVFPLLDCFMPIVAPVVQILLLSTWALNLVSKLVCSGCCWGFNIMADVHYSAGNGQPHPFKLILKLWCKWVQLKDLQNWQCTSRSWLALYSQMKPEISKDQICTTGRLLFSLSLRQLEV